MAQVTKQEDAGRTQDDDDGDTTVTHVGDGPERVVGPSGKDLAPKRTPAAAAAPSRSASSPR